MLIFLWSGISFIMGVLLTMVGLHHLGKTETAQRAVAEQLRQRNAPQPIDFGLAPDVWPPDDS